MWLVVALLLRIPLGLDLYMPVPEDNPITSEKVELGRRLFQDRRLSRDGRVSVPHPLPSHPRRRDRPIPGPAPTRRPIADGAPAFRTEN